MYVLYVANGGVGMYAKVMGVLTQAHCEPSYFTLL